MQKRRPYLLAFIHRWTQVKYAGNEGKTLWGSYFLIFIFLLLPSCQTKFYLGAFVNICLLGLFKNPPCYAMSKQEICENMYRAFRPPCSFCYFSRDCGAVSLIFAGSSINMSHCILEKKMMNGSRIENQYVGQSLTFFQQWWDIWLNGY